MGAIRPFVDRPVDDRDAAFGVACRQAAAWDLPPPTVLRHGMNALYVCGDVVLRVGAATAPAALAHDLVRWLLDQGVPTVPPIDGLAADVDGLAVTAWQLVDPVRRPVDWSAVGRSVRTVHGLPIDGVPIGYPLADAATFPWWDFETMLADVAGEVDEAALAGLRAAIDGCGGWPERVRSGVVLCHGDVHPGNVLVAELGPLLIDWDLLCVANPAWDAAMVTAYADRWGGDPAVNEQFLAGYGSPGVDEQLARSLGELRNVAATLMRIKAGRDDPDAAVEAERRLRYWRGDPAAPTWRAQ